MLQEPTPIRPLGKPFEWVASAGSETLENALRIIFLSELLAEIEFAVLEVQVAELLTRLAAGRARRGFDFKRIKSEPHLLMWELRWDLSIRSDQHKLRLYLVEQSDSYLGLTLQLKKHGESSDMARASQNVAIQKAAKIYSDFNDRSAREE